MDELKWLQDAAGQPPAANDIDVTRDVMRTLRKRRSAPAAVPMLFAVALASWMLAGAAILVAYHAVSTWQNPLAELLRL